MKKTALAMIGLFIASFAFSQSLPNHDFEVWDELISEPESWSTPNPITGLVLVKTVTKSDDAYSGSYSARLETTKINFLGSEFDVPGMLTLGEFELNLSDTSYGFSGGYYLQENVSRLNGMYKYTGVDGDSAFVFMYNYKMNDGVMDTIGYGYKHLHDAAEWTSFSVDMQYISGAVPDTFNVVIISSGDQTPSEGSVLLVDNLTIEINTAVDELAEQLKVEVYPNPTENSLYFRTKESSSSRKLSIFNTQGQKVKETRFMGTKKRIETYELPSGVYSYQIQDDQLLPVSGLFIKQ